MKSVLTPVDYQVINNLIAQRQQVGLSQFTRVLQSLSNDFMCEWDGNTFYIYKNGEKDKGIHFVIGDNGNLIENANITEVEKVKKEIEGLYLDVERAYDTVDSLGETVASQDARVSALESDYVVLEESFLNLLNDFQLHNHDDEYAKKVDVESLSELVTTIKAGLADLKTRFESHSHDGTDGSPISACTCGGRISELEDMIQELTAKVNETATCNCSSKWNQVNSSINSISNKVNKLEPRVSTNEGNISSLAKRVSTCERDISDLEDDISDVESDVDDIETTIVVTNAVNAAWNSVNSALGVFNNFANTANAAKDVADSAAIAANSAVDMAQSANDAVQNVQDTVDEVSDQVREQQQLQQRLVDDFEEFDEVVDEMGHTVERTADEVSQLNQTVGQAVENVSELRNGYARLEEATTNVSKTINSPKWITGAMIGTSVVTELGSVFASQAHSHDEYATHDELYDVAVVEGEQVLVPKYAAADHTHEDIIALIAELHPLPDDDPDNTVSGGDGKLPGTLGGMASLDNYYTKEEVDELIDELVPAEHTHDEYALVEHTHDEYSTTNHTHATFNNKVTITTSGESDYGLTVYNTRSAAYHGGRIRIGANDSECCIIGYNRGKNTGDTDGCTYISHVHGNTNYAKYEQYSNEHRFLNGTVSIPSNDIVLGNGCIQFQNTTVANDYGRIKLLGSASNAGELEIATADDGNEPVYVRQYSGNFATVQRTLTLLDESGNTSLPGDLTVKGTNILTQLNNHTHDEYASVSHNHDEYLTELPEHTHEEYCTKEEVDDKLGLNQYGPVISMWEELMTEHFACTRWKSGIDYPVSTYLWVNTTIWNNTQCEWEVVWEYAEGSSTITYKNGVLTLPENFELTPESELTVIDERSCYIRQIEHVDVVKQRVFLKEYRMLPEKYALHGHTHDEYASTSHTHDEYASVSHTHDEYASVSHTHNEYLTELPPVISDLKQVSAQYLDCDSLGQNLQKAIVNLIYPVGALYTSFDSTSPATRFGFGTWTQITDRFLYCSNSSGSTGGSKKISVANLPAHNHTFSGTTATGNFAIMHGRNQESWYSGAFSHGGEVSGQGGFSTSSDNDHYKVTWNYTPAGSINNTGSGSDYMPPYITVYAWRRTA